MVSQFIICIYGFVHGTVWFHNELSEGVSNINHNAFTDFASVWTGLHCCEYFGLSLVSQLSHIVQVPGLPWFHTMFSFGTSLSQPI